MLNQQWCKSYTDADTSKIQSYWRAGALGLIQLIHVVLKIPAFHSEVLADSDVKSNMVIALCKFLPSSTAGGDWTSQSHEEQWTSQLAGRISQGTLSQILPVNGSGIELSRHILTTYIKPIFSASPNVFVDPETGRKLHRPLGGDLFRDTFRDDPWKGKTERDAELGAVGCWRVYEYVLEMLQVSLYRTSVAVTLSYRWSTSLMKYRLPTWNRFGHSSFPRS